MEFLPEKCPGFLMLQNPPLLAPIFQSFNPQNDRIWAKEAPETNEWVVERTQKPKSVMVCAAITSTGKTPLVFVEEEVKINRWNYMEIVVILDFNKHFIYNNR